MILYYPRGCDKGVALQSGDNVVRNTCRQSRIKNNNNNRKDVPSASVIRSLIDAANSIKRETAYAMLSISTN